MGVSSVISKTTNVPTSDSNYESQKEDTDYLSLEIVVLYQLVES